MTDPAQTALALASRVIEPMALPANDTEARKIAERIGSLYTAILREVVQAHKTVLKDG